MDPTASARALSLQTHPLPTRAAEMSKEDLRARATATLGGAEPIATSGSNYKTKPIIRAASR